MVILGIGDGADAGAALVVDDRLVAATEQERLDRVPRSRAFPWEAIDDVLAQGGVTPADVDLVAVAGRFTPPFFVRRHPRLRTLATDPFSPARDASVFWQAMLRQSGFGAMEAERVADWFGARLIERGFRQQRVLMVDVHRALASAAYRTQPDDDALVVTMHPMGDGAAVAVHRGGSGQLDRVFVQRGFAALHVHLARCAASLGLDPLLGDDPLWGLAARGEPDPALIAALNDELHADGGRLSRRAYPVPERRTQRPWRDLAEAPLEVAAASILENLTRAVLGVVREHLRRHPSPTLVIGGGVLDNPRLVAALAGLDGIRRLETCPLQGWASLPMGAAVAVGGLAPALLRPPGIGRSPDPETCRAAVGGTPADAALAAEVLARGGTVARFAGPAGFSRHGSGTRSVLVRADDPAAVQRARAALGRPDAAEPGLAAEAGVVEVEHAGVLAGPLLYGAAAPRVVRGGAEVAGGLTADGRAHLHLVREGDDPGLASILAALRQRTGVPAVAMWPLGTGNEPAVARPADAVAVWRGAGLDGLQLGPVWAGSPR